jgi:molybdate transport repressor ModE-like protein
MDWENLKYFLALSRAGSITQAAAQLGVNYTTVARRLSQLEKCLNTQLFDRLPSGIRLTDDGQEMLAHASIVEQGILSLESQLTDKNEETAGVVTLTIGHNLSLILMPCLKEFLALHPAIQIELLVTADTMDIEEREADISVRCTQHPPENVLGRKIADMTIAPYAQKGMIDKEVNFGNLASHPWIVWRSTHAGDGVEKFNHSFLPENLSIALTVSDANAQLQAVKDGVGLAWLWRYIGDTEPDIEVVSQDYPFYDAELWVLMHKELLTSTRHKILYEYLSGWFKRHPLFQN